MYMKRFRVRDIARISVEVALFLTVSAVYANIVVLLRR